MDNNKTSGQQRDLLAASSQFSLLNPMTALHNPIQCFFLSLSLASSIAGLRWTELEDECDGEPGMR